MNRFHSMLTLAAFALAACTTPEPPATPPQETPPRIFMHYSFAGDWGVMAGDGCEARAGLSQEIFLRIGLAGGGPDLFLTEYFFMLEESYEFSSAAGQFVAGGVLPLSVMTRGIVDGREAAIEYQLTLTPEDAMHIRLTGFTMAVSDGAGDTVIVDLLAEAAANPAMPELSIAGPQGLCLKRL